MVSRVISYGDALHFQSEADLKPRLIENPEPVEMARFSSDRMRFVFHWVVGGQAFACLLKLAYRKRKLV